MPPDHRLLLFPSTLVVAFSSPPIVSQSANKLLTRHAERWRQKKIYDHRFSGQERPHALQQRYEDIESLAIGGLLSDFIIFTGQKKLFTFSLSSHNYNYYIPEKKSAKKIFLDSQNIRQKTQANRHILSKIRSLFRKKIISKNYEGMILSL